MVGVLAIQGGYLEHEHMLIQAGVPFKEIRSLKDVEGVTAMILPGGESTVMDLFMQAYGLKKWLLEKAEDPSFVIFGTCAGLILLARWGLLNVDVERNAYGRQLASFTTVLKVVDIGTVPAHFIRAPKITRVGEGMEILAEHAGVPVLVRQGQVWGASFHPELAENSSLHARLFS